MFGIFKKQKTPEGLVDKLSSNYFNCAKIINDFYGIIPRLHEPGIFVVGIASYALRLLPHKLSPGFIGLFSCSYLSFVASSFEVEDGSITYSSILHDFNEHGEHYSNIISNAFIVAKQNDVDKTSEHMQILFDCYFENCTGADALVLSNYDRNILFDNYKLLFDEAVAVCRTTVLYLS